MVKCLFAYFKRMGNFKSWNFRRNHKISIGIRGYIFTIQNWYISQFFKEKDENENKNDNNEKKEENEIKEEEKKEEVKNEENNGAGILLNNPSINNEPSQEQKAEQ